MINYNLHKLPEGFIITSDEKPLIKGDKVYNPNISKEYTKVDLRKEGEDRYSKGYHEMTGVYLHVPTTNPIYEIERKVIAQQESEIDFNNLSEDDCKKIGWFDVEKRADNVVGDLPYGKWVKMGYIQGFKIPQKLLSDKMFTLEDLKDAFVEGHVRFTECGEFELEDKVGLYIQSLQNKSWTVELEMSYVHTDHVQGGFEYFPTLNNGKVKILKII